MVSRTNGMANYYEVDFTFIKTSTTLIQAFANKTSHTLCFAVLCPLMPGIDKAQVTSIATSQPTPNNSLLIWQSDLKGPLLDRV